LIGDIYKTTPVSAYAPSKEVQDFTSIVKKDFANGDEILNRGWTELNGRSVIEDMNRGQRMFNAFVDEDIDDPVEAWKYRGTRSMARNKGIAMHAQLTAAYLIPGFSAQNDADEIDRDFSNVMRDIVEWMTLPTNSNYQSSFVSLVFGMIEAPCVYLGAEFFEVYQKIKERTEDGKYAVKEVLDEILSGFKAPVYSTDQILISNAYERNIQKHRCIIKRRYLEFQEAEAKYGEHDNWAYVQPGIKTIYSDDNGLFYDIKDDDHPFLVEEVIYLNRREDTEAPFINGIYMGDSDIENNPIKHRDNRNAPKYNVIPFRYNLIGSHFFYGKSMMNAMRWDNQLYDAMSELLMNRAFLEVNQPVAVTGSDKIDSEIIFPSAITAFKDKDTKVIPLLPPANLAAGFQALMATKDSIDDSSLSDVQTGQLPQASQKAYSVAQAQANAKKLIAGVGKSLAESIVAYGPLMADIALNHLTTAQVDEITGSGTKLKYRKFILEKQMVNGKQVDKEIRFDENLIAKNMTDSQKKTANLKLLEEVGWPDNKKHLYIINPHLFSKFRYLCRIDPEEMFPRNSEQMSALLTSLYQLLANDPMVEHESLLRELMYSYFKGRAEDFIAKKPIGLPQGMPTPGAPSKSSSMGSQVRQKQMAGALQDIGVQ